MELALVRRRAGRLPVRHPVRRLRRRLPLPDLAAATRRPRCSTGGGGRRSAAPAAGAERRPARPGRDATAGAGVHPPPVTDPLAGAPAGLLGVHARRPGDVPAGVRAAPLRVGGPERPTATRCSCREIGTLSFDSRSVVAGSIFHPLDIAAVLVLAGVFIFLPRRLRDPGALAVERATTSWRSPACSRSR